MDTPTLKEALARVHAAAQQYGGSIVSSRTLQRKDRELLVRAGWLIEIIRGWYMFTKPGLRPGESSSWYANFWDFVAIYLQQNYQNAYCLSAENSIDLHIANPTIPKQVIAMTQKGGGTTANLPFNTSILIYPEPQNFPTEQTEIRGIRAMSLPLALCRITPSWFQLEPENAEVALRLIKDPSILIHTIAKHGFCRAAERIIGAYRALQDLETANAIANALQHEGMQLQPVNPFKTPVYLFEPIQSAAEGRIRSLWNKFRLVVIEHFPPPPSTLPDPQTYLERIDELFVTDAYHSLSIEGYRVNLDLIQKIEQADWNPDLYSADANERDALAARGYYEAFQEVKKSISKILDGQSPGTIIKADLQGWFQKLFAPSVAAHLVRQYELTGYRKSQVYIRNSRYIPLAKDALLDAMQTYFDCLTHEPHPAVRAILGHFIFVYIHPYMDGNGRLGRFIMNAMLASGGYPRLLSKPHLPVKTKSFLPNFCIVISATLVKSPRLRYPNLLRRF
ncbi:MAG: Fic family protein [Chlamydiia bacterium]|nr:Fic family protein [Chlamydiia bacterium]